jgi:hypothetical protein
MKKTKFKYMIKKHNETFTTYERSWLDCQENNSDSYYPVQSYRTIYSVFLNGKKLKRLDSEYGAKLFIKRSKQRRGLL